MAKGTLSLQNMESFLQHLPELMVGALGTITFSWVIGTGRRFDKSDSRIEKLEERDQELAIELAKLGTKLDYLIELHEKKR